MISRRQVIGGWGAVAAASALGLGARHALRGPERTFGLAVQGSGAEVVRTAEEVGSSLDRTVGIVTTYQAWEWAGAFPWQLTRAARSAGMTPQITWEPWDPRAGADQDRYQLTALSAFDEYVDGFAASAAADGGPVNLRFAHEMNGIWYPWATRANRNTEQDYVDAYRRLHGRFDRAGADNVSWTWCPNVVYDGRADLLAASYPGDDVVDVISVDGYDDSGVLSPEQLFGETLALVHEVAPDKPVWINETGCAPGPHKAGWIDDLVTYLDSTPVDALVWFELVPQGQPDWRLLESRSSTSAATSALARW